jgi:hypothetical protein
MLVGCSHGEPREQIYMPLFYFFGHEWYIETHLVDHAKLYRDDYDDDVTSDTRARCEVIRAYTFSACSGAYKSGSRSVEASSTSSVIL